MIAQEAARGLESSQSWRWKFWKRTELNVAEAEQCLDRLETLQPDPGQQAVLQMARAAAPPEAEPRKRLAVMQAAMQTLTEQVSGDLVPLAGVALKLRERSDPALETRIEQGLAARLPPSGVLGEVAPDPGWLLEKAHQPYPASATDWSVTLQGTPPACVRTALERLAPQDVQSFVTQTRALGLASQAELERDALATFDQNTSGPHRAARHLNEKLPEEDVRKLGGWLAENARPQPLATLASRLDHPEAYRTLARHLDQPDWLGPAATELHGSVPAQKLAACLGELAPAETALAWLQNAPEEGAVRGLQAFGAGERSRPALLLRLGLPPAETLALVDSQEPLLRALLATPWPDEQARARAVATGWKALEENPTNLAGAGLRMARAVTDINQKLFLARATLQALGADGLLALTRAEGPNQEWSQAALGLAALRHLEQGAAPGPKLILELTREACETWAAPPWRTAIFNTLAADPAMSALGRSLLEDPEKLSLLATDTLLTSVATGLAPSSVEENDHAVIVGGVRVAKRGAEAPAGETVAVQVDTSSEASTLDLGPPPQPGRAVRTEWREKLHRGLAVVYNPLTGEFESRDRLNRGMAGVFNPREGKVVFQEGALYRGVGGCYDPTQGKVIFKSGNRLTTTVLVFNPRTRAVVDIALGRNYGAGAAYNPATGEVDWKTGRNRAYAALYHPDTGQLEWREKRHRGFVAASNDPEFPTLASSSYAPYESD